jgi:outer membrane immunogenic protein
MRVKTVLVFTISAYLLLLIPSAQATESLDEQLAALEKENSTLKKLVRIEELQKENARLKTQIGRGETTNINQVKVMPAQRSPKMSDEAADSYASANHNVGKAPRNEIAERYDWSGSYFGANVGYELGYVGGDSAKPSGAIAGIQAGRNFQIGNFVFGAEADVQLGSTKATSSTGDWSNPAFGTVRGRVGAAFDNILVYGTGGIAIGALRGSNTKTDTYAYTGDTRTDTYVYTGFAYGGGVEYGLKDHWSLKAEYIHYRVSDQYHFYRWRSTTNGSVNPGSLYSLTGDVFRVGFNYRN